MTGAYYDVVNRYAFLSECVGISADEDERPDWQLVIAASQASPLNDPHSAIRNLKANDAP